MSGHIAERRRRPHFTMSLLGFFVVSIGNKIFDPLWLVIVFDVFLSSSNWAYNLQVVGSNPTAAIKQSSYDFQKLARECADNKYRGR